MKTKRSIWKFFFRFTLIMIIGTSVALWFTYKQMVKNLPDIAHLEDVQLQVPLKIYSLDGKLIGQYGSKRRIPITLDEVPALLIHAVLATEDQRFYEHPGVDIWGLMRAAKKLVVSGERAQGGSTITMQVARNFFLSRKKTYTRKLNEILLAIEIDNHLSKNKILELYLNKIYFGNSAYGVAAAAKVYYGKSLKSLTLSEIAMLAGLPKAPSSINPLANPDAAITRRNHVLARMYEENYIDESNYQQAVNAPITAQYHSRKAELEAPYVAELAREMLVRHFGKDVYTKGYQVYTTIDSRLQNTANSAITHGILAYDKRHGFKGAIKNITLPDTQNFAAITQALRNIDSAPSITPACVINKKDSSIEVLTATGDKHILDKKGLSFNHNKWNKQYGPPIELDLGDVIYIQRHGKRYILSQLPDVEAAIISVNPNDGAILAMTGGFDFKNSKFNRVIQANRQVGSCIKPFIYSAALDQGFTLASVVNDAPIVVDNPKSNEVWRPQNASKHFFGPTRLREGLIRSRNIVCVRLLQKIGIAKTINYLKRFGLKEEKLPRSLSLALGAGEATPLNLSIAYSTIANTGFKVTPYVINHVLDMDDNLIFQAQQPAACPTCQTPFQGNPAVAPKRTQAPRVVDEDNMYLISSVLRDVVKRGTGRRANLSRGDVAGKTGTTNNRVDAWFSGFTPDMVTVTWMGYDKPESLDEYASQAVIPIWTDYMKRALHKVPVHRTTQPNSIVHVKINRATGTLATSWDTHTIFELFRAHNVPKDMQLRHFNNPGSTAVYPGQSTQTPEGPTIESIF